MRWKPIGGVVLATIAGALYWRYASRRRRLPCPAWLAPGAGNRGYEAYVGTQASLHHLAFSPGMRVLDVGAGWGRLAVPAAQRVAPNGAVVALDLQPAMLRRLRAAASQARLENIRPVIADAARLPFRSGTFDLAYFATVLGEIPEREAALRGCFETLRPAGRLAIMEILPDPHYESAATVRRLAQQAGFVPQALHGSWWRFTAAFVKPAVTQVAKRGAGPH